MPKEPTSVCPFCFPFYPLSQRILLPSRLKHCFWDYPRPALPPPGLQCYYWDCLWAILPAAGARCGLSSPMRSPPAAPQSRSFPQAAVHRSNQSPSRLPLREQAEKPGNQKGTRCPADALFCFLGVLLTCGIIPGSGGFPECSAQHRTVRRRAAAKSAAEGAAHRRSKWRCPDQAGMPSVRWQWLYGAGH